MKVRKCLMSHNFWKTFRPTHWPTHLEQDTKGSTKPPFFIIKLYAPFDSITSSSLSCRFHEVIFFNAKLLLNCDTKISFRSLLNLREKHVHQWTGKKIEFYKIQVGSRMGFYKWKHESETIRACDASQFCVSEGLLLCRPLEMTFTQCNLSCEIDSQELGSNLLPSSWGTKPRNG